VNTHQDLARELDKLPGKPRSLVMFIAQRAREGYYHDFLSPLSMPKIELVHHLRRAGLHEIADRVKGGEFDDESPDDECGS
jgi:hypothetical protein